MKNKLVFVFIVLNFTTISCSSQKLSKTIDNIMGGKLFLNISGNLYLKQSNEKSLLLLIKSNGSTNFDKSMIIFSEVSIPKLIVNESDIFEVKISESRKYAILYNRSNEKIYFIGTIDSENEINTIKKNTALTDAVSNIDYLGYGFSYLTGSWSESRIKESKYTTPTYTLDYSDLFNTQLRFALPPVGLDDGGGNLCAQGSCSSGGNGSTSCSISEPLPPQSCTVTCSAGFYACCTSSTVRCICCKY